MSIFLLLSSLQGLATSGIFFSYLIYFSLSQYPFNVIFFLLNTYIHESQLFLQPLYHQNYNHSVKPEVNPVIQLCLWNTILSGDGVEARVWSKLVDPYKSFKEKMGETLGNGVSE